MLSSSKGLNTHQNNYYKLLICNFLGLTVYFAPSDRTFIVDVNRTTGIHQVKMDDELKYRTPEDTPNEEYRATKQRHIRQVRKFVLPW